MSVATKGPEWHDAFPKPQSAPAYVSHEVLREMIEESAGDEDTGFVVVDVRRTDFEGSCVRGAVNIPAQSFPLGLDTWSKVFGDRTVIFHCSSSNGRGPRCAAWYQDCEDSLCHRDKTLAFSLTCSADLDEHQLPGEAAILQGGIKEWTNQYGQDEALTTRVPDLK